LDETLTLDDQIVVALRRITRAIDLHSRMLLHDHGLTAPQLMALRAISRRQPVAAGEISRVMHLGQPTLTGVLDRLERRGLVRRSRDARDRRSVNLSLTDEGSRVLQASPSLLQDRFRQRLGDLPQAQRTRILATLQQIADMMDAGEVEATPLLDAAIPEMPPHEPS